MGLKDYAVLIPTKGRARQLTQLFSRCPSLNRPSTYIGLDSSHGTQGERGVYTQLFSPKGFASKVRVMGIHNPDGYTSVAREQLRRVAVADGYRRYVLADDNCVFNDGELQALLDAQACTGGVVGGFHPTAPHFHAKQIAHTMEVHQVKTRSRVARTVQTYEQVGMIFWCVPGKWYKEYRYPEDCYFDDVHFIMWMFQQGFTNFRCCVEAKFNKHLHEPGGTGNVATRIYKRGISFARLAQDFPQFMTTGILMTRVPYKKIARSVAARKD